MKTFSQRLFIIDLEEYFGLCSIEFYQASHTHNSQGNQEVTPETHKYTDTLTHG
jgi:hypothetical protein